MTPIIRLRNRFDLSGPSYGKPDHYLSIYACSLRKTANRVTMLSAEGSIPVRECCETCSPEIRTSRKRRQRWQQYL